MRIGINGQRLLLDKLAGAELYTVNIIKGFAKVDLQNQYIVYLTTVPEDAFWHDLVGNNPNLSYKVVRKLGLWTQFGLAFELLAHPVDVFFSAVHTFPIIRHPKTKYVGMIHGLEYRFNDYRGFFKKLFKGKPEWFVCMFSNIIITPSEATKNEILKRKWVLSAKKIHVVSEGVSPLYTKKSLEETQAVQKKYDLNGQKYLTFISTVQPRKNIPGMIQGFSMALKEANLPNVKLLIIGKKGWFYEKSLEAPIKYGVEKNVIFAGYLPAVDVATLLSGSVGFVNVSFEEGFGLPLLEAMNCEVPCVVSDIPAFREVGGENVLYCDPNNPEDIKNKLLVLLQDKYSEVMVTKAKQQAGTHTWENTAQKTLEIFNKA
ncbi:MAG: mannosyltransferase B-like protein [uncultured bacterium]|nr:MAG: mannosyltransferase B-like protein [uncultured bacterium]